MFSHILVGATASGASRSARIGLVNVTSIIVATGSSGTPSATVQLEGSLDNATWIVIVGPSNITSNGQYKLVKPIGEYYEFYRINVTGLTGTITLDGWIGGSE